MYSVHFEKMAESPFIQTMNIPRFSGTNLVQKESVSDHVSECIGIAIELRRVCEFDLKTVIYKIAIHDLGECFTGDIIRPTKYYTSEFKEMVDNIEAERIRDYIDNKQIEDDIIFCKEDKSSLETCILIMIDSYQAVFKLWREYNIQKSNAIFSKLEDAFDSYSKLLKGLRRFDKFYNSYAYQWFDVVERDFKHNFEVL